MPKKFTLILGLVILLAFFLRFYKITEVPPALNWDEASIAYNAYSVLKTGRDEWGELFPLHFKSYGEYKLPAQIYFSIPGVAIFGLSELGVRITPVIYGALTVLLMFFLGKEIFGSKLVGLISSFLLAVSPWHIQLTRGSFESSFATFWVVLGVWLLIKGFRDPKWVVWSMIPFAISVYTYNTTRVFTPLFLLTILFFYIKHWLRFPKMVILSMILFSALMIPLIPFVLGGEGGARYKLVSVADDPGLIPRINEHRANSQLPATLSRLIHNRVTYISKAFITNYSAHFSPSFLFISGAPHKHHHVQGMGELFYFQAPFLLLGLYLLFSSKQKFKGLLISWIILAFVPVAVTNDSIPNALRTLVAAPFYQLIAAFGFVETARSTSKKLPLLFNSLLVLLALVVVVEVGAYLYNYHNVYPVLYSRDWQYGYKEVVGYIKNNRDKYDEIVFTRHYGEPHMFTLFFLNIDPSQYFNDPKLIRFETYDWVRVLRFDKLYFPDLGDPGTKYQDVIKSTSGKKILFIGKPGDFPSDAKKIQTVYFLNGKPAFEMVGWP